MSFASIVLGLLGGYFLGMAIWLVLEKVFKFDPFRRNYVTVFAIPRSWLFTVCMVLAGAFIGAAIAA